MKKSCFFTGLFAVCLVFLLALPAQAANAGVMMLVGGYDNEGKAVQHWPAVAAVYEGATYVDIPSDALTYNSGISDYCLVVKGEKYPLSFYREYPDLAIAQFTVSNDRNVLNAVYATGEAHEGEVVTLHYLDEEVYEQTISIQITGYAEHSPYYLYEYVWLDDVSGKSIVSPVALINDQGDLIGYGSSKYFYTYLLEPGNFSSSGSSGSGGSGSGVDLGGSGRTTIPSNEAEDGGQSSDRGRDTSEDEGTSFVPLVIGIVVAAAVIAVVVSRFRKKTPPASNVQPEPAPDSAAPPAASASIPPTEAAPSASRAGAAHRVTPILYAEGGVMGGRRYPISAANIVIGRDPSCTIRYPDGTPGISRRHCTLFWQEGVLMLMDTGSSHGTFLQGQGQLPPNQPMALKSGDVFYLGEKNNGFVLRFE